MGEPTASTSPAGNKEWRVNGQLHRLAGPAVEYATGRKEWYVNGQLHRLDGPAIEAANGGRQWWVHDKRHRLDGPAREYDCGGKQWWVAGRRIVGDTDPLEALGPATLRAVLSLYATGADIRDLISAVETAAT